MNYDSVKEMENADLEEWAEVMETKLEELFKHCEIKSASINELHDNAECGVIIEIVKSRSGKEYFVVVLLQRACINFIPVNEVDSKHDYYGVGTSLVIRRNMVNDIEYVKISDDIYDSQKRRVVAPCGLVARYIYRYNDGGKKEAEYFIGNLRITNLATDYLDYESSLSESDDPSSSDSASSSSSKSGDSTTDSEFSNSDADSVTSEDSDDNHDDERDEERPDDDDEIVNYLPNIVYRRFLVPQILLDCRSREDDFYARDNIPFIWMPGVFASNNCLNETESMQALIPWKIPRNTICLQSDNEIDIPNSKTFRGCFVDDSHIFLSLAQHSLALFSGCYDFGGEETLGRFLHIDEKIFDHHLNTFIVRHAKFETGADEDFGDYAVIQFF